VPYLTPDSIPEDDDCRPLLIPASSDWLAIVSGALTELVKTWNWQQEGAVTVDEAVAAMQVMVSAYYDGCQPCTQFDGARIIRLNEDGHVEELDGNGDYVPASGDYYVPPPAAREGGTADDQICLAAANCENILHELYNQLADYFASELSAAEAITALIEWLIITLGAEFAPITYALALFLLPIFTLVYSSLSFITADLWDSNFTERFKCLLVGCATNVDGVVTFDYQCVTSALYSQAITPLIDETKLRLWAQISYILQFVGGADALNTAGATTGITEADCSDCSVWGHRWTGTALSFFPLGLGTVDSGGIQGDCVLAGSNYYCGAYAEISPIGFTANFTRVRFEYEFTLGNYHDPGDNTFAVFLQSGALNLFPDFIAPTPPPDSPAEWVGGEGSQTLAWQMFISIDPTPQGSLTITAIEMEGTGEDPFPGEPPL